VLIRAFNFLIRKMSHPALRNNSSVVRRAPSAYGPGSGGGYGSGYY
jgi:hypothetical protein